LTKQGQVKLVTAFDYDSILLERAVPPSMTVKLFNAQIFCNLLFYHTAPSDIEFEVRTGVLHDNAHHHSANTVICSEDGNGKFQNIHRIHWI
jgi:hypothetical protein